jgi:aminoglycoside phosphotransferase (APT) family kinase protein
MEFVPAEALGSATDNAGKTPGQLREASLDLTRVLAKLHALDPELIGLGDFGRPEGYLARQLRRWAKQLEASRSRPTPDLDRLIAAMPAPPESPRASVVHGDFKMNNALVDFSGQQARIAAVLDWEMATLGDPYSDLAMFGMYWDMPEADPAIAAGFETPVDRAAGYPAFDELLGVYERESGRPLPDMHWYRAFAAMKIGVISESLHYRHHIGAARGSGFELMGPMTEPIARIGLDALSVAS